REGNQLVFGSVALEERTAVLLDAIYVVVAIGHDPTHWKPWIVDRRDVGHRRERVFEDQGASTILGGKRDSHRAAQCAAHEHHIAWLSTSFVGEPTLGRISIGDATCLIRPTLAVAVAAVVEDEHGSLKPLAELGPKFSDR